MNKSLLIASILALNTTVSFAGDVPLNAKQMSQILQNIQKDGYNLVTKIEFNDDKFEAKAINSAGKEVKLEIAPMTGEVINPKKDEISTLTIFDVAQKVEGAGYKNIYLIDASKDTFKVKAHDKDNKKVTLEVDGKTGAIKD